MLAVCSQQNMRKNVMVISFQKQWLIVMFVAILAMAFTLTASAATTGAEFASLVTKVSGWLNGSLGKLIAIVGVGFAIGMAAVKQDFRPLAVAVLLAAIIAMATGVVSSMFTAII